MTTSVAMCTYNGARFIEEQLDSILNQSLPIDEIVICDDGSTDNTVEIIQKIAKDTSIPIHVHINETNLGCVANFEKAIRLCQGDIIFLSDQDDVWMHNKVEAITHWFEQHPTMNVVFGDAILIDEFGKPIMKSAITNAPKTQIKDIDEPIMLWEDVGFSSRAQQQFDDGLGLELWLRQNRATGATMAVKRNFVQSIRLNYDDKDIYHDFVLTLNALVQSCLGYITQPLTYYRLHLNQCVGCSLSFPKQDDWDNTLYPGGCWEKADVILNAPTLLDRLYFANTRFCFKYSFLAKEVIFNFFNYRKIYTKNWYLYFKTDYYLSMKHSILRIKNYIKKLGILN